MSSKKSSSDAAKPTASGGSSQLQVPSSEGVAAIAPSSSQPSPAAIAQVCVIVTCNHTHNLYSHVHAVFSSTY